MMLQTEYDFTLPRGLVGDDGVLHRNGKMRLATAADEIMPLRDPRVQSHAEYLIILILSRVVTEIGALRPVTPEMVERLFVPDLAYLQDLYNRLNQMELPAYEGICEHCGKPVKVPVNFRQAGQ
jgi:hypothetical protein